MGKARRMAGFIVAGLATPLPALASNFGCTAEWFDLCFLFGWLPMVASAAWWAFGRPLRAFPLAVGWGTACCAIASYTTCDLGDDQGSDFWVYVGATVGAGIVMAVSAFTPFPPTPRVLDRSPDDGDPLLEDIDE